MWLLKTEVAQAMREARRLGYEPTAHERREFAVAMQEAYAGAPVTGPRNLKVAGNVAQIDIDGVLTEKPDCFSLMFGGGNTTYQSIREALATADADPAVSSILLKVSSPGGQVTGLFETLAALEATKKPISSIASLATSAAYAIVAVAGPIRAATPASQFGSIGVATSVFIEEDVIDIASTEAPNKRPDASTEEGLAVIRQELDAIHEIFADAIAGGRDATTGKGITTETVNSDFGRGSVLLASEAKKRGMIDSLAPRATSARKGKSADMLIEPEASQEPTAGESSAQENIPMATTKKDLLAQHAELVAELQKEAVAEERERVDAHLFAAEESGDMKTAIASIRSGEALTPKLMVKHMMFGRGRSERDARQKDSDAAGAVLEGAEAPVADGAQDLGDQVADRICGVKKAS